ncbi:MAG: hypothetical protein DCF23_12080 [Cyanobium sp.]|nr:MAG: hypothetical protein DCF23_12080 [Cyanobium sp.]
MLSFLHWQALPHCLQAMIGDVDGRGTDLGVFLLIADLLGLRDGGWTFRANVLGRTAALLLLGCFALALVAPTFADRFSQPLIRLGSRLSLRSEQSGRAASVAASALLGLAIVLLLAHCAVPIHHLAAACSRINGPG